MFIKLTWSQLDDLERLILVLRSIQHMQEGLLIHARGLKIRWDSKGVEIKLPEEANQNGTDK